MKAPYFSMFFFFFFNFALPTTCLSQISKGEDENKLIFSSVDSSKLVGISFYTDGTLTENDGIALKKHLDSCLEQDLYPLDWGKDVHSDVNLFFKIKGKLDPVLEATKSCSDLISKGAISWIWAEAQNPEIIVSLGDEGRGVITLMQDGKVVGQSSCRSAVKDKLPTEGTCHIVKVWKEEAPTEYTQNDQKPTLGRLSIAYNSWMPWALETDNPKEGIFLHGGSLATDSKGCVRMPKKFAEMLHGIVQRGTEIKIQYAIPLSHP